MTLWRLRGGVPIVLALVGPSACGPEVETEVWEGEHLQYRWESTLQPCEGAAEYSDAFIPFAAAQLGLDAEGFGPLSFTLLSYEALQDFSPYTENNGGGGFARLGDAYSSDQIHLHELAHIVVHEREVGGLRFFREGLAVALSEGQVFRRYLESEGPSPRHERVDPRPVFDERRRDGSRVYPVGGAFTTYLLSRYGPERLLELHEGLTATSSPERVGRVFERVYGLNLDDEVDTYVNDDTCPEEATEHPQPYACTAPTIPWESLDRWSDVRPFRCYADPDAAEDDEPVAWSSRTRTIEIPADGLYRIHVFGDPRSNIHLFPCGRCPWLAQDTHLTNGAEVIPLSAGLHAIAYSPALREPSVLGVTIEPVD